MSGKRSRRPCCVCGEPLTLVARDTQMERVRKAVELGLTIKGQLYESGNHYLHPVCDYRVHAWLSWKKRQGTSASAGATGSSRTGTSTGGDELASAKTADTGGSIG